MPLLTDNSGHPLVVTIRRHNRRVGHRRRGAVRITRAIDTAFAVLYVLLAIRLLLEFFHADGAGGIAGFFTVLTSLFIAPFRRLGHRQDIAGQFPLDVSILVAILGYAFLQFGLTRLVHRAAERRRADDFGTG